MQDKSEHIILFDGVCNLCNHSIAFVLKRDKKKLFQYISLQSDEGQTLLKLNGLSLDNFHSLVYIKGGKALQKSTAALNIVRNLSGLWPLLYIFILVPKPLRDWAYGLVAKNRYRLFGKSHVCELHPPENKSTSKGL
ncbi:MAG: DUF393 domain-containing protein [Flavobacteriaceae bacterium]|nr:DUF393 domain-containing protein [Flavobacteriaceae bacterium]